MMLDMDHPNYDERRRQMMAELAADRGETEEYKRCEELFVQIMGRHNDRFRTSWFVVICLATALYLMVTSNNIGKVPVVLCSLSLLIATSPVLLVQRYRRDRIADRRDAYKLAVTCEGACVVLIGRHKKYSRFFAKLMAKAEKERRAEAARDLAGSG